MRSPADMEIIQIDITNACTRHCSNCTRFCGLHTQPFFMDLETFKRAVNSLQGYDGVIGLMGGEPTLHPQFGEILKYYCDHVPEYRPPAIVKSVTSSFRQTVERVIYQRGHHRGIWSSLGAGYYRYFEEIQDRFPYQVLNDHNHDDQHKSILIPRRELGISDEEWIPLRDRCWVQNLWSASITPKGAFFCEIAASLDILFDGPGGWPVEPGWWKRKPEDFADQLHWCEMCSLALQVPAISADAETELMSPGIYEKLKDRDCWKIRTGHYQVLKPEECKADKEHDYRKTWFLPNGGNEKERVSPTFSTLYPHILDTASRDGKGTLTLEQVQKLEFPDFVLLSDTAPSAEKLEVLKHNIFNPGIFYDFGPEGVFFNRRAKALAGKSEIELDNRLKLLWPKGKRVKHRFSQLGHLSLYERICQKLLCIRQRGMFLLPEWLFRVFGGSL